jgi:hypothetical protein
MKTEVVGFRDVSGLNKKTGKKRKSSSLESYLKIIRNDDLDEI